MADIRDSIVSAIGNTPLVRLNRVIPGGCSVLAKLEFLNPLLSVKDRIAAAMVLDAEERGVLRSGGVIIEPTSGNTGLGLAFVGASRGYRVILVMPETMSAERRDQLLALGAEVVLSPGTRGMSGAAEMARTFADEIDGGVLLDQFSNPANPEIHRTTTAEEIWSDTGGVVDVFLAGVGTGGTITGVGEVLKRRNPDIQIVAVEPERSSVLSGGSPGPHGIQGIGAGFVPDVLNQGIIDEIVAVRDEDAYAMTRRLAREEGILAGISSGAAVHAAAVVAGRTESRDKTIVTILPDSGTRYASTGVFDE